MSTAQTAEKRSLDYLRKSDRHSRPMTCLFPRTFREVQVRCQTCEGCRNYKRWLVWKKLAAESAAATRVWFVTLTIRRSAGYRHVSAWLKRTRAAAAERDCTVRFFAVAENGELKGRLHWHVLLFLDKPLSRRALATKKVWATVDGKRKRVERSRWKRGFHHWELASNPGNYVSKSLGYVTKGNAFRGSNFLGQFKGSPAAQHALVQAALATFSEARPVSVGGRAFWREKTSGTRLISPQRAAEISALHAEAETCEGRVKAREAMLAERRSRPPTRRSSSSAKRKRRRGE